MREDEVWQVIDQERASLADLFDDLTAAEWETPSLCDGWRVREVAAHLTLAQFALLPAVWAFVRARGDFDRMIRDTALVAARQPVERYAAALRGMVGSRRKAPGITYLEPLIDVLVHGQDIALPLRRNRPMPVEAAQAAATRAWTMGRPFHAQRTLAGLRLEAADCAWAVGEGLPVRGPIAALLLLVTGRGPVCEGLHGEGLNRLMITQG